MKMYQKHIIIWVLYSLSLYFFFEYLTDTTTAVIHVASFVGNQLIAFYINLHVLLPKLYQKHRYALYVVCNVFLVFGGSLINTYSESFTPEAIQKGKHVIKLFDLEPLFAHAMPSVLSIFAAFMLYAYYKRKQQEEKELEIVKAEKSFLVQQINPHFLFNTLNNIYSLTIDNDPRGSEAILQLSKMLDYSLYGNKYEFVPLKEEITYILNFINLFKIKDDEINNISFTYKDVDPEVKIAPMLLLPFVENAFKHGNIEDVNNGFIEIIISTEEKNSVYFSCINTYSTTKKSDNVGGIGITNVTRRLELLYPNKHDLLIIPSENQYKVILKVDAHEV